MDRILITGGAGFIGSNLVRMLVKERQVQVVNLDKLTYAGNLQNLADCEGLPNYRFFRGDVAERLDVEAAFALAEDTFGGPVDAVLHLAAESHVDRSIEDPSIFLRTNVTGTQVMLHVARSKDVERFVHVSTDEVYGALGAEGEFTEETPLAPNSPYSASKAGSDLITRAYYKTYGMPVVITRCSNNYGPFQFPEKLIPLMISNALENRSLPLYGDGLQVRDWIHVEDHCRGLLAVLEKGRPGEVYNLGGRAERSNLEVVTTILSTLRKPDSLIRFVVDRPGHDRRYAMGTDKAERELGWRPSWTFENGMRATIQWYLDNQDWMNRVRSGSYLEYYQRMYANR